MLAARVMEVTNKLVPPPRWFARYSVTLVSPAVSQTLWLRGRHLTGNDDLGFAIAESLPLDDSVLPWAVLCSAPTLRAGAASFARWSAIMFEFNAVSWAEDGDLAWLRSVPPRGLVLDRGEQDFRLVVALRFLRAQLRMPTLVPRQVHVTYPRPSSLSAHRALLGTCELRFDQPVWQLAIPRALFDVPLPGHDPAEFARLEALALASAGALSDAGTSSQVEASLTSLLATHTASARAVAKQLGLSVRTLRRRLAEEGRSFQQLVDEVRRRELELHAEPGLHPISRLAQLVGFSSDRALRLALRRWRGDTPIGRS